MPRITPPVPAMSVDVAAALAVAELADIELTAAQILAEHTLHRWAKVTLVTQTEAEDAMLDVLGVVRRARRILTCGTIGR